MQTIAPSNAIRYAISAYPNAGPGKSGRLNFRRESICSRGPWLSSQELRQVNLTAHGYFDHATEIVRQTGLARNSTITTATFVPPPLPREYRARRDDILPIACASATPAHHSRKQNLRRISNLKPQLPTFECPVFPARSSLCISSCRCDDFKIGTAESFVRR